MPGIHRVGYQAREGIATGMGYENTVGPSLTFTYQIMSDNVIGKDRTGVGSFQKGSQQCLEETFQKESLSLLLYWFK